MAVAAILRSVDIMTIDVFSVGQSKQTRSARKKAKGESE